jgi:hypothetical protein
MQKKSIQKLNTILFVGITILSLFSSTRFLVGVAAERNGLPTLDILILTNREVNTTSAPYVSLNLDTNLKKNLDVFTIKDDTEGAIQTKNISKYDVVVFDSYLPNRTADIIWLYNEVTTKNIGILFFGGNYTPAALGIFGGILPAHFIIDKDSVNRTYQQAFIDPLGMDSKYIKDYLAGRHNLTETTEILTDQIQVAVSAEEKTRDDNNEGSIFSVNIAWESCPLLRERVFTFAKKDGAKTLIEVPNTKEPLVVIGKIKSYLPSIASNASVLFISTGVGMMGEKEMNEPFKLWPYFNYLMYASVYTLAEKVDDKGVIESYAEWPWSPIPHAREATIWMIFVASLWVFNFWLFFTLGRKKKAKDAQATNEVPAPSTDNAITPSDKPDAEPKL